MSDMPPSAAFVLGITLALFIITLIALFARRLHRWRITKRVERGYLGEKQAPALLARAGWRVLESQPTAVLHLTVDGEDALQPVRADFLCERGGRTLPAEVKTGKAASSHATLRQLLEYAVAFETGAVLLVSPEEGTVREVSFPVAQGPLPRSPWATIRPFALGLALGTLLGAGLVLWCTLP